MIQDYVKATAQNIQMKYKDFLIENIYYYN
jgi:hypothetical protein